MKQQLNVLLSKEMDRKDFLKHMAAMGIMLVGGGAILQSLGSLDKLGLNQKPSKPTVAYGYGNSVYGGRG